MDHPDITHAMQTGYPADKYREEKRYYPQDKTSMYTRDYYGDIIDLENDHYVVIPTGYKILHRNLQRYLEERRGFEFSYYLGDGEDSE